MSNLASTARILVPRSAFNEYEYCRTELVKCRGLTAALLWNSSSCILPKMKVLMGWKIARTDGENFHFTVFFLNQYDWPFSDKVFEGYGNLPAYTYTLSIFLAEFDGTPFAMEPEECEPGPELMEELPLRRRKKWKSVRAGMRS